MRLRNKSKEAQMTSTDEGKRMIEAGEKFEYKKWIQLIKMYGNIYEMVVEETTKISGENKKVLKVKKK